MNIPDLTFSICISLLCKTLELFTIDKYNKTPILVGVVYQPSLITYNSVRVK